MRCGTYSPTCKAQRCGVGKERKKGKESPPTPWDWVGVTPRSLGFSRVRDTVRNTRMPWPPGLSTVLCLGRHSLGKDLIMGTSKTQWPGSLRPLEAAKTIHAREAAPFRRNALGVLRSSIHLRPAAPQPLGQRR